MDWNCTLTEERLSDFLEGTLLPEEAAAFSAHSAGCANCTKLVAQVSELVSRMQQAPPVEAPPLLAGKILEATLGPRKQRLSFAGLVRVAAGDLATAFCDGNGYRGGFVRDRISCSEFVGVQDEPESHEPGSRCEPAGPSHVRAWSEVRERPARRL